MTPSTSPTADPSTSPAMTPTGEPRPRRRWPIIAVAALPVVVFGSLATLVTVPYVAMIPGPTLNTLADCSIAGGDENTPIVKIDGAPSDPTSGNLNMTTVGILDSLSIFDAARVWVNGNEGLVPRSNVYPPDQSREETEQQNAADFTSSEDNAEIAALSYLGYGEVTVESLSEGSPAAGKLEAGDRITAFDSTPVTQGSELSAAVAAHKPGDTVTLTVNRAGQELNETITLGEDPQTQGRAIVGITMVTELKEGHPEVSFCMQDVGGPSAGLMFTLATIDKLTPGPLNDGKFVAGTGTIDPSGNVGAIGGIQYKMRAARDVGAETFLVPVDNCEEALEHRPDGLRLVKVDTLSTAVAALDELKAGTEPAGCTAP